MTTIQAVYEHGVLRPALPLPFAEGEKVELIVTRVGPPEEPLSPEEAERRVRSATTLQEAFLAANAAQEDETYDLLQALDENRKGERPLFPPALKGVSW
jgi:predicted DNA-binding antitoxin AbrB/MazE fold protein